MKKKIIFVFPRFHNNKYYVVKKLIQENFDVNFLVAHINKNENHDLIKPIFLYGYVYLVIETLCLNIISILYIIYVSK